METKMLNSWLTLGANVGVLIGIILLLIELDQNTEMMRAQMIQARADNLLERYRSEMHSDYWPAIRAKRWQASSSEEYIKSLTPEEFQRVRVFHIHEINDLRNLFYQYQEGFIDQRTWDVSVHFQTRRFLTNLRFFPGIPNPIMDPEFEDYLNSVATQYGLPKINEIRTADPWLLGE